MAIAAILATMWVARDQHLYDRKAALKQAYVVLAGTGVFDIDRATRLSINSSTLHEQLSGPFAGGKIHGAPSDVRKLCDDFWELLKKNAYSPAPEAEKKLDFCEYHNIIDPLWPKVFDGE